MKRYTGKQIAVFLIAALLLGETDTTAIAWAAAPAETEEIQAETELSRQIEEAVLEEITAEFQEDEAFRNSPDKVERILEELAETLDSYELFSNKYVEIQTANGLKKLTYDGSLIQTVGTQEKSKCLAYALAYCRTILDGYAHTGSEYWEDGLGAVYPLAYYKKGGFSDKQSTLKLVYDEINAGRPVCLYVTGNYRDGWNAYGDHWVTVVGYRAEAKASQLKESDFYVIDPSGCVEAYLMDGCSKYADGFYPLRINNLSSGVPTEDTETEPLYDDVPETSGWRYEAIKYVTDHGIMNGISGTNNFDPDSNLKREMFATIIYRMEGSPPTSYDGRFPDVKAPNYYVDPISWASQCGIINGHSNTGLFGVYEDITREDLVVIMYHYSQYKGYNMSGSDSLSGFSDAGDISGYAKLAMQWAVANGIVNGRSNTGMLDPKGNATRVEAAAIIQRFMEKY